MSHDRKTILLVDDTPLNLELMQAILAERYKLKIAIRGERAIALAQRSPSPDLVLLDWEMPEMNGDEVCERLKADPQTASIPVLFITGHDDPRIRKRALQVGAAALLVRPIDPVKLHNVIDRVLTDKSLKE